MGIQKMDLGDNKELSGALSQKIELIRKQDRSLYDVMVHEYESRKKHRECPLNNHSVYLLIEDVSKNYANDMENATYYQCVCLECGRIEDFKMSIADRRKVVDTHFDSMAALMSFYEIRQKYLELKAEQLPNEEIASCLNAYYNQPQEKTNYKRLKKL